jgi:SAM-dependent MidA family methyltransferase
MSLPLPDNFSREHSQKLCTYIDQKQREKGWLSFAEFMELALYAPGLGYYAAGASKFGESGDFVTAPEMTPLFAQAVANQVAQIMGLSAPNIIEAGAGTGRLAADLLLALEALGQLPDQYAILELSADLRERQQAMLQRKAPHLLNLVVWLDRLPKRFDGVVLGNELIDAMPVHLVEWSDKGVVELGVVWREGRFDWDARPASGILLETAQAVALAAEEAGESLPEGYRSEIPLAGAAWAASWGSILGKGALLLIDYGFPAHEFYHPLRTGGTLMCHYRHHAHPDPFYWPGLQDITAHVDFTSLIAAAFPAGLELLGYTSQGQFLLNCNLLGELERFSAGDTTSVKSIQAAASVNRLILPQEMGELFKVIVMGRGLSEPLLGFQRGDRSMQL